MYKVYSVKINGRTFESRNLRELLARAVSAKRNPDPGMMPKTSLYGQISTAESGGSCMDPGMAVVH